MDGAIVHAQLSIPQIFFRLFIAVLLLTMFSFSVLAISNIISEINNNHTFFNSEIISEINSEINTETSTAE